MESAGVRICREAGGRVVANAMLREFDLAGPNLRDQEEGKKERNFGPSGEGPSGGGRSDGEGSRGGAVWGGRLRRLSRWGPFTGRF